MYSSPVGNKKCRQIFSIQKKNVFIVQVQLKNGTRHSKCHLHHLQQWCKIFRTSIIFCSENGVFFIELSVLSIFCLLFVSKVQESRKKVFLSFLVYLQCILGNLIESVCFSIYFKVTLICCNFSLIEIYALYGINSFLPEIMAL